MHKQTNTYPLWAPRFWHGMLLSDWISTAAANQFRMHPLRWALATSVTAMTAANSVMRQLDQWRFANQVSQTELIDDPVFILGHWRSGTTFLHELLAHDERFHTPTTYQCFAANHFLLTEWWMPKMFAFLMPSKRPMDNVRLGWNEPQEDEFALCSMGLPSPYRRIAFPKTSDEFLDWLDMRNIPADQLQAWQDGFQWFLKRLTLSSGKQIALKSPTHTGRLALLHQMFPNAKFLHIVRNPFSIYPSTVNLWNTLDFAHGLQIRQDDNIQEYVLTAFERMYSAFEDARTHVPANQIYDIHYERLAAEPIAELNAAYQHLDLGDFSATEQNLRNKVQQQKDYKTNRYQINEDVRTAVVRRWQPYFERYGYDAS